MNQPIVLDDVGSLKDLATAFKQNKRFLLLTPVVVGTLVMAITFAIKPTFTATASFLAPQQQSSAAAMLQGLGALGGLAGAASGKNPGDQYAALLKSRSVQDALIKRFDLRHRYDEKYTQDARKTLAAKTRITSSKEGIITVEADDYSPDFSAELANAHVSELKALLSRLAITDAQQRRFFYERQLEQAKDKLTEAQTDLQRSGIKEGALRAEPKMAAETYASLKAEVTAAQVKVQSLRSYMTEESSELRMAQATLSALQGQLARAESSNGPDGEDSYIAKYRKFKYQETLFDMFAKQYELAKLDEAREGAAIQVVDVAVPPEKKSKPQRVIITLVSMLISAVGAFVYVMIRRNLAQAKGAV